MTAMRKAMQIIRKTRKYGNVTLKQLDAVVDFIIEHGVPNDKQLDKIMKEATQWKTNCM